MINNRHAVRAVSAAALAAALSVSPATAVADAGATAGTVAGTDATAGGRADVPAMNPGTTAGGPSTTQADGWEQDGLRLNAEDNRTVDRFMRRAARTERLVSPQVMEIARRSDAELVGFDKRLKSEDSLKRKVATWLQESPEKSVNDVLDEVNDSVRYTFQFPDAEYTEGVRVAAAALSAWHHDTARWSNTWKSETGYKAINSAWREPVFDHVFEVQFHTPASRQATVDTHPLYEEQRLPSTSPERAAELRERQRQIFAAVPVPAGAEELTAPAADTRRPVVPRQRLPLPATT